MSGRDVLRRYIIIPGGASDSLLNARIRVEGTRKLLEAIKGLAEVKIVAQSVAWTIRPGREADAISVLEDAVLAADGVALRYGFLYGPGTYFESDLPPTPHVHIESAAAQTLEGLVAPTGVLTIVDGRPNPAIIRLHEIRQFPGASEA